MKISRLYMNVFASFIVAIAMIPALHAQPLGLETFDAPVAVDAPSVVFKLSGALPETYTGRITNQPVILADGLFGSYAFETRDTVRYYPAKPLRAGKTYQCRLNPDFFKKQKISTQIVPFDTPPLSVSDARLFREAQATVRLAFNDQVSYQSLIRSTHLFRKRGLSETALSFTISPEKDSRVFLMTINEAIGDAPVRLSLGPETVSTADVALPRPFDRTLDDGQKPPVKLDKKRRSLVIHDPPRFHAMKNGKLAIRVYLPAGFYGNTNLYSKIRITGMDAVDVGRPTYISAKERKAYKLNQNSQYFYDVTADFKPGETYDITFEKGLRDAYYFELKADKTFRVAIGDRHPSLRFTSDKPYLAARGSIGFEATNIESVTLIAERLADQNYRYFINFMGGNPEAANRFSEEILNTKRMLRYEKNAIIKHRIQINDLLSKWQCGVYRFSIRHKESMAVKTVFISDIGISARLGRHQLFVTAVSLGDATPVANAQVTIYSDKNSFIADGETGPDGVFVLDRNGLADMHPRAIVVEKANDRNFLVLDPSLNDVSFGQTVPPEAAYRAMLYLQSQLIRPGGDARFALLVKDDAYRSIPGLPVRIRVTGPDNDTIHDQTIKTDSVGAAAITLPISRDRKTGRYRIQAYLGDRQIGRSSFRVEAFMPQRIRNTIRLQTRHQPAGQPLLADIVSYYLFGAPAAGLSAEARLHAVAANYSPKDWPGYSFTNQILAAENTISYLDTKKQLSLDEDGKGQVIFATHVRADVPSILQGQIGVTVFDAGRGVSTYEDVTLYPYDAMVGVRLTENPESTDAPYRFRTVLLDPLHKTVLKRPLHATLKRRIWHYTYDNKGRYRWNREYKTVDTYMVAPEQEITRQVPEAGQYALLVTDRLTGHSATVEFNVYGWGADTIGPADDMASVELEFEDRYYRRGDVLKAGIRSPIEGRLLVTLEGEAVFWHKFYALENNTAAVSIPLDFPMDHGAYLQAYVVRATDSPAALKPFRARGHRFIKPYREQHRLNIAVDMPDQSQSRRQVRITVSTGRPDAMLLVSVVDTGILQIVDQQPPDPFAFFYSETPLQVALYDFYDQVAHYALEGKQLSIGGDDSRLLARRKKHLAPESAEDRVTPFLYWSGLIAADAHGNAEVNLDIPDFNGRADVSVIGVTPDTIGAAHHALVVKDDIILKPTTPRFMLVGDSLDLPVRIFNNTRQPRTLALSMETAPMLVVENIPDSVAVPADGDVLITARLTARENGSGFLEMRALDGDRRFYTRETLPIHSPAVLDTRIFSGEVDDRVRLDIPQDLFAIATPQAAVAISDILISRLKGSFNDLIQYPYGCSEQTASRMLAMLYAQPFLSGDTQTDSTTLEADRKALLEAGIEKLEQMQNSDGYFTYWPGNENVNVYASAYASDVVLQAKTTGLPVKDAMIRGIYRSLENIAAGRARDVHQGITPFTRLYAAYLLACQDRLDKAIANHLYDSGIYKKDLVCCYLMAALLKQADMQSSMGDVLTAIEAFDPATIHVDRSHTGDFDSKPRDLGFALYLHATHFRKNAVSLRLLEALTPSIEALYSTQDKAFVIRGLYAYYQNVEPKPLDAVVRLNTIARRIQKPTYFTEKLENRTIDLKTNSGQFYYYIAASGLRALPPNHDMDKREKPLRIHRDYVDADGETVSRDQLRQQDLVYSRVRIAADMKIENMVVNDRIPACFEIVNQRLDRLTLPEALENVNFKPAYQDFRDDRVLTFLNISEPERKTPGSNTIVFHTPLRVTHTGTCVLPAIQTEAMYDERLNDYDLIRGLIRVRPPEAAHGLKKLKHNW